MARSVREALQYPPSGLEGFALAWRRKPGDERRLTHRTMGSGSAPRKPEAPKRHLRECGDNGRKSQETLLRMTTGALLTHTDHADRGRVGVGS